MTQGRRDEQVLQMMRDGWRNQQLSRNLQFATIEQRLNAQELDTQAVH